MVHTTNRQVAVNLRGVPRDLRDMFKAYCAKRGCGITEVLTQYMHDCITGEQERKERREELRALRERREIHQLRNPRKRSKLKGRQK